VAVRQFLSTVVMLVVLNSNRSMVIDDRWMCDVVVDVLDMNDTFDQYLLDYEEIVHVDIETVTTMKSVLLVLADCTIDELVSNRSHLSMTSKSNCSS